VAVALVGLCGLALVPLALSQNRTGHASWIAHFPLGERLGQIIPQFLIGTGAPAYAVLEPLAAAMVVAGLVLLALRAGAVERRAGLAMAGLAIAGLLLNLLLVAGGVDDLLTRNLIVIWLPAAIAVATGLGARRAGWLGVAAAVVLCATGVATTIGIDADWKLQRPDWRAVAAILGPRPAGPGSRVILIQHYRDLLPLSLYEPGLRFWRSGGSRTTSELDVVAMQPGLGERACWWGAACNLIPSQLQAAYRIPGLHELWVRRFRQFSVMRLIAPRPVRLSAAAISGALQSTRLAHDDLLVQG
jgi:hypothetical protein